MLMSRVICQTNWNTSFYVVFQSIISHGLCVFITAGPITKLFAGGGGGEWRTCAMRYDEPRLVWTRLTTTH